MSTMMIFFSSRRRHTRCSRDWSSDVCSSDQKAFCLLSGPQAALYQKTVDELERAIAGLTQGIERRGLVLAYLMRFKQICNHPAHWLGEGAWDEAGSGKLARLREIVEAGAAQQEKVLVFTQFRAAPEPLAAF